MRKYLVIYHAPAAAFEKMKDATPEQMKAGMEPWMKWAERCGDGLVDLAPRWAPAARLLPRAARRATRRWSGIRFCRRTTRQRRTPCCRAIPTWNGRKAARSKSTRPSSCRRSRLNGEVAAHNPGSCRVRGIAAGLRSRARAARRRRSIGDRNHRRRRPVQEAVADPRCRRIAGVPQHPVTERGPLARGQGPVAAAPVAALEISQPERVGCEQPVAAHVPVGGVVRVVRMIEDRHPPRCAACRSGRSARRSSPPTAHAGPRSRPRGGRRRRC